jgi:hypothetical protein
VTVQSASLLPSASSKPELAIAEGTLQVGVAVALESGEL